MAGSGPLALCFQVFLVPFHIGIPKRRVFPLGKSRQQSLQGVLYRADHTESDGMPSAHMRGIEVDLDDLCVTRIKLPPGKVCSQQQQGVTAENTVVTRFHADDASHSD